MKIVATLTSDQLQLLQENASIVGDNYFLPYWFKRIEGNKFELHPLGNLPPEMSAEIAEMRRAVEMKTLLEPLEQEIGKRLYDKSKQVVTVKRPQKP